MGECTMGTGKNSLIPKKTNPPTCTQVTVEMKERRDYNESHTGLQEGFRAGFRSGGGRRVQKNLKLNAGPPLS